MKVKVKEGSGKPTEDSGYLVIHTAEKRENNRANLDVARQLAEYYGVDISDVRLLRGRASRSKTFMIRDKKA